VIEQDVSIAYASAFCDFAEAKGTVGSPVSDIDAFVRRVPGNVFCERVARAVREHGDRDLALRFGSAMGGRGMGLLGLAVSTAPTLAHSLASLARWEPLVGTIGRLRTERRGAQVRARWEAAGAVPPPVAEGVLAGWVAMARLLSGEVLPITRLEFAHARGAASQADAIVGCDVRFGAAHNAVVIPTEVLEASPRYADARMHGALAGWFDECRGVLVSGGSSWLRRASVAILEEMCGGGTLELRVAERLGVTLRTLQRRLGESGFAFRRLRDLVRANVGLSRLAHGTQRFLDISQDLGFEEQASFSRAVRQWTDRSPREVARLFDADYAALRRPANLELQPRPASHSSSLPSFMPSHSIVLR
jgi:AraC-like DNA-binding protein